MWSPVTTIKTGRYPKSQTSRKTIQQTKKQGCKLKINIMDTNKIMIYQDRKANPTTVWLLFLLLGWSYGSFGKIGLQILFYLTLGGLGIWALVRLFTLSGEIQKYNRRIAAEVGLSETEKVTLGVY
jgi:hypothetical protein